MIEIKKLRKKDHNLAIFKDGKHVDAIVQTYGDPSGKWRRWGIYLGFNEYELFYIEKKISELNEGIKNPPKPQDSEGSKA